MEKERPKVSRNLGSSAFPYKGVSLHISIPRQVFPVLRNGPKNLVKVNEANISILFCQENS